MIQEQLKSRTISIRERVFLSLDKHAFSLGMSLCWDSPTNVTAILSSLCLGFHQIHKLTVLGALCHHSESSRISNSPPPSPGMCGVALSLLGKKGLKNELLGFSLG
jgi:hypothetical protein